MNTGAGPGAPARAPMRSLLVRNVIANVVTRGLSILAWLAITPWVLRSLGPERFGFWSLLSMLASTALLLDLGLGSAVTRFVAQHAEGSADQARRGAFSAGVMLSVALALAWGVAGLLGRGALLEFAHVGEAWRAEAWSASGLLPFAAAAGVLSLVPAAALAGVHRLDLANRVALGATLVQLSASVWVLQRGGGLPGLTAAMALGSVTSLVAGALVLRSVAPGLRFEPGATSATQVLEQMRFSAALQVISLGVLFQFQLPKLALARWSGLASVGEFELGYRVAFAAWSLPSLLLPPLLPAFTELTSQGRWDSAWALHQRAGRYLLIVALPVAALLTALSPALYGAWLGPGHAQAALALAAIATLLGINVLTSAACLFARAVGRPWMEARYHALSFVLHLALLALLVPRFGLAGGLVAMLVSGTVATGQFLWVFHRAFQRSGREFVARIVGAPAVAAIAGGAAAWGVCAGVAGPAPFADRARALLGLAVGGGAGVLVTVAVLFAVRAVSRAELAEILHLVPRPGRAT